MARKSAAVLKSVPVKIRSIDAKFIEKARKAGTPEGTEEAFDRYLAACQKEAEAQARVRELAKIVDGKGSEHPEWANFLSALDAAAIAANNEMRSLDHWQHTIKHLNDAKYVSEEDLRAVVKDSLSDKTSEIVFTVNYGLLGSQIAATLKRIAIEAETGTVPLCRDCTN